jgi:hypothetical protein
VAAGAKLRIRITVRTYIALKTPEGDAILQERTVAHYGPVAWFCSARPGPTLAPVEYVPAVPP